MGRVSDTHGLVLLVRVQRTIIYGLYPVYINSVYKQRVLRVSQIVQVLCSCSCTRVACMCVYTVYTAYARD
jgi:hypothetical protein